MRTLILTSCLFVGSVPFLQAEVVAPGNMGDWSFAFLDNDFNPCASCQNGSMVYGPATPPLGLGSANLGTQPGNGGGAASLGTTGLDGVALGALTTLTYSTYDTVNNGSQFPFLRLNISYTNDANNDGPGIDSLFFEPPYQTPTSGNPSLPNQGAPVQNLWQSWNALAGGWWDNNGVAGPGDHVAPLSTFLSFYTNPVLTSGDSFFPEGLVFTVGEASAGNNFNGYVDDLTVGVNGQNTTYDFEPTPEPSTIVMFGSGLVALGLFRYRKSRLKA